ncbi:MAG: NACHT domain-containing protein [Solirubrobacteraceae bacterium]
MSPRPGGETAKFGDRFEGRWTVSWMLEVLYDRANSIMVETIDDLHDTAEFEVRVAERNVRHQVKRQLGQDANWTMKRLKDNDILQAVKQNVDAGHEFCFVSTIPAVQLEQLTDLAGRADDQHAFAAMLAQKAQRVTDFRDGLVTQWKVPPRKVFEILRNVRTEKPSEDQLRRSNAALAEVLVDGPGAATAATLAEIAAENLGRTLSAAVIWQELEKRGLRQLALQDLDLTAVRAAQATERWRRSVTREHLDPAIQRAETSGLIDGLRTPDRLVLVTGGAGSGKSGIAEQVLGGVASDGWAALGFRLDRRQLATTSRQLGEQLDLPASPVITLAKVAQGADALLVIDQLDAVSVASGRLSDLYEVIDELLREARQFPNVRVLLACRSFDVQSDPRLRKLAARDDVKQVEVAALSASEVDDAVAQMGINASRLTAQQRSLLSSPFSLVLLRAIADGHSSLEFSSMVDLLNEYWDRKRRDCMQTFAAVRFEAVVDALVAAMSSARRLDAPVNTLDVPGLRGDADVMASEHVLVIEDGRAAFFHESLFDYAFARLWTSREESLVEFLVGTEQGLFRRAQVRQVLAYLRQIDRERYLRELQELLSEGRIRFHLKHSVLALLRATPDPLLDEWTVLHRILASEPEWAGQLALMLRTTVWFDVVDGEGKIESWLDEPSQAPRALELMLGAVKDRPGRIGAILVARRTNPEFPVWFRWLARWAPFGADRGLFELLLDTVRADIWREHEHELWLYSHGLAESRADWSIELLHCWLTDRPGSEVIQPDDGLVDLNNSDHGLISMTTEAARKAPAAFCDTLLPWMLRAMAMTQDPGDVLPITDRHFAHRMHGAYVHDLADGLLAGATQALQALARDHDEALERQLGRLASDPHDGAQFLLYKTLTAADDELSDRAGEILPEGEHRFRCGYGLGDTSTTREMIQARAPGMSDAVLARLEGAILAYEPESERRAEARRWRGSARLALLDALPQDRLTERGQRVLGELQRKLGTDIPPPFGIVADVVHSPIDLESCKRMSDEQWIGAIYRYRSDDAPAGHWGFTGGGYQLSQHLEELTKEDPIRFARLGLQLTTADNDHYLSAILRGIGNAEVIDEPEPVIDLILHAGQMHKLDVDRWLSWPLRRLPPASIPAEVVDLLIDRARCSPDPSPERDGDGTGEIGDLEMLGVNSVRGTAALALGDLVIRDGGEGEHSALITDALPVLVDDPSAGVRTSVAHILRALLPTRPAVLDLLPTLLQADERMLATRPVENLLAAVVLNDFERVRDVIGRMLVSERMEVRQAGGRLLAWAAVITPDSALLEMAYAHRDETVRKGAAEVLSGHVRAAADRQATIAALIALLRDPSAAVHDAAAHFVVALREENLGAWRELVLALIESPAFDEAIPQLAITLEGARGENGDIIVAAARRFDELHGAEIANIATGAAGDAKQIGDLVLRAERQGLSPKQSAEALDVIDALLLHGAYGFADAVSMAER